MADSRVSIKNNQEEVIPISSERDIISKNLVTEEFIIEKRWLKKYVQVPIAYEEIFVNGKRFSSKKSLDSLLQSLSIIGKSKEEREKAKNNLRQKKAQEIRRRGEKVPLFEGHSELEKILPLYGERITVNRKMVKYAEAVIAKKKVSENRKVKVQLKGEKVMIRYPDGTERTLESTSPAPQLSEAA